MSQPAVILSPRHTRSNRRTRAAQKPWFEKSGLAKKNLKNFVSHDTDNIFLRLADRWSLSCDKNQWILIKREGKGWRSKAFIGSNKATLTRILREEGITPTPEAEIAMDGWPEEFLDWILGRDRSLAVAAE